MDHLRSNGFRVDGRDVDDLRPIKAKYGVPGDLVSCHTGVVAGYVVEGHVPADVIAHLLRERPNVAGIAVPGMPSGSPGMVKVNRSMLITARSWAIRRPRARCCQRSV